MNTSTDNIAYWKEFWSRQTTPLHRHNTEEWYLLYAKELNLIFTALGYTGGAVLESGCGNGALFEYLDINKEEYLGTDLSDSLLGIFKAKHPNVSLLSTDSCRYSVDQKFSLIFSNGVIQNFDKNDLDIYMNNSIAALDTGGILLLGNVLWKDLAFSQYHQGSIIRLLKSSMKKIVSKDDMGYWYAPKDFEKYRREGVEIHLFGSLFHPYRFSLALKKSA
jgi:cyclopropane fatty-acyl-phospholipid synthase-like methyltransferase